MNMLRALHQPKVLPALTGLNPAEFAALTETFGKAWDAHTRRPKDKGWQRRHDSGKKQRHTVKNVVVTQARRVQFLSRTAPGHRHDKHLAEPIQTLPADALVLGDSGFQGWPPTGATVILPAKKPRGGELHPATVVTNRALASCRVVVEHTLAGVKRCRIVSDIFRHLKPGFTDLVLTIACGLHNFRTAARSPA